MPNGIIYIARNHSSDPKDHYKIGKSYRANPDHRMKELTSETTNYRGEYVCEGYVSVNDVDECERLVHQSLDRIKKRREFFEASIDHIVNVIRSTLSGKIKDDHLPNVNDITLRSGDSREYSSKHILNFTRNVNALNALNFYEICKYADIHKWHNQLCHGDGCCKEFRHAFYILIYKHRFIQKLNENPNFTPVVEETSLGRSNITKDESLKLQKLILKTSIKELMTNISFPNNLMFLGVAIFSIGEEIEKENRLITKFIINEFKALYPRVYDIISELDKIYYSNGYINSWRLEIFERMVNAHNS